MESEQESDGLSSDSSCSEGDGVQYENTVNDVSNSDDEMSSSSNSDEDSFRSVKDKPDMIEIIDSDSDADEAASQLKMEFAAGNHSPKHPTIDTDDDISFNDLAAPVLDLDSDNENEGAVENTPCHESKSDDVSFGNAAEPLDSDSDESDGGAEEDEFLENIQKYQSQAVAQSRLLLEMQGFRRTAKTQSNLDTAKEKSITINRDKVYDPPSIVYGEKTYHINRCYTVKLPNDGMLCTVGILRFIDRHNARCILTAKFEDTFLGIGGEGYDIDPNWQGIRVQIHKHVRIFSLSEFHSDPKDGDEIPQLIYEPRQVGSWHTFGYFYDRQKARKKGRRDGIRSLEMFAGAGGSLLGYHDEGFQTVMAIEKDRDAVNTLKANNPKTKVYEGCVKKFLEDYGKMSAALGVIDHLHFSSPCQDFSKANRSQSSGRRDRADLTLLLLDAIKKISCSTVCFENVAGIFDRNNIAYLKKLSIGLLQLGYQMRCTILRACDYGDAQKVRLINILLNVTYFYHASTCILLTEAKSCYAHC